MAVSYGSNASHVITATGIPPSAGALETVIFNPFKSTTVTVPILCQVAMYFDVSVANIVLTDSEIRALRGLLTPSGCS